MRPLQCTLCFLVASLVPALTSPARAQPQRAPAPAASLLVGLAPYDLGKTGTGVIVNAGVAFWPAGRILIVEPAVGFFFHENEFSVRTNWFFPELGAQAEVRFGVLRPFIGGGAGAGVQSRPGSDRWLGTLHSVAGVRLRLSRGWGARAELRLRAVLSQGHTADFGVGVIRGMR